MKCFISRLEASGGQGPSLSRSLRYSHGSWYRLNPVRVFLAECFMFTRYCGIYFLWYDLYSNAVGGLDTALFVDEKTGSDSETERPQSGAVGGRAWVSDLGLLTLNTALSFLNYMRLCFFPLSLQRPYREGIREREVNMSETLMREVAGRAPGGKLLGSYHSSVTGWLRDLRHPSPSSLSLPYFPIGESDT